MGRKESGNSWSAPLIRNLLQLDSWCPGRKDFCLSINVRSANVSYSNESVPKPGVVLLYVTFHNFWHK